MAEKKSGKFMVQSAIQATTGRGKAYLRLKLLEAGGKQWPAIFWEDRQGLKGGTIVDALVEESEYSGEAQLTVHALRELPNEPPDSFLPKTPYNIEALFSELLSFVGSVVDSKFRQLLERSLTDEQWKRSPAATQFHHAHIGGLLEHTVNVCRLVDTVCLLYPRLRRDLLLSGAILHDYGKTEELNSGITIEYSDSGLLEGHIILGLLKVNRWMDELEFDKMRRDLLNHLIISHHGNKTMGSPKEPVVLEAQILCDLDGVDAHIGAITAVLDKTAADQVWSGKVKFEQRYFLGGYK